MLIKLKWLSADPRWGPDLLIDTRHIQAVFRAPHHALDKQANCTRICLMSANETGYYDVEESLDEILTMLPHGTAP